MKPSQGALHFPHAANRSVREGEGQSAPSGRGSWHAVGYLGYTEWLIGPGVWGIIHNMLKNHWLIDAFGFCLSSETRYHPKLTLRRFRRSARLKALAHRNRRYFGRRSAVKLFLDSPLSTKALLGTILILIVPAMRLSASATDFYITQSGAGSATGSSLANAASCGGPSQTTCAAFNLYANWGTGAGKIGCGTTVHLNGSFVAAAGASLYFWPQVSGCSGNPIIGQGENNFSISAPYWWLGG